MSDSNDKAQPVEMAYEDFVEMLKNMKDGKNLLTFAVSIHRDGEDNDANGEAKAPDAMVVMRLENMNDKAADMVWNSLFSSAQMVGFVASAMHFSEAEAANIKKQQENPEAETLATKMSLN